MASARDDKIHENHTKICQWLSPTDIRHGRENKSDPRKYNETLHEK